MPIVSKPPPEPSLNPWVGRRNVEFWYLLEGENDPNWERDLRCGQEIGVIIALLIGAVGGMVAAVLGYDFAFIADG
jgi:hypothetical protein